MSPDNESYIRFHDLQKMAQAASITCEICNAEGTNLCSQCNQLFCDECKTSHLRVNNNRNHIFLTGLDINPEEKRALPKYSEHLLPPPVQTNAKIVSDINHSLGKLSFQ